MSLTLLAHGSPDPRHARDVGSLVGRLKVAGVQTSAAYLDHHGPSSAQGVGSALVFLQKLGELAQHAGGHGDVALRHIDACGRRERADDGQEGGRGQTGCFVGQGVDDGRLLGRHGLSHETE